MLLKPSSSLHYWSRVGILEAKHSPYWTQWMKHRMVLSFAPFLLKYYNLKRLQSHLCTQPAVDWFVRAVIHQQDAELQSLEEFTAPGPTLLSSSWDAAPPSADGLLQLWGQEFEDKQTAVMFYSKTSHCKMSDSAADSWWLRCPGMGRGVGWTDGACDAIHAVLPPLVNQNSHMNPVALYLQSSALCIISVACLVPSAYFKLTKPKFDVFSRGGSHFPYTITRRVSLWYQTFTNLGECDPFYLTRMWTLGCDRDVILTTGDQSQKIHLLYLHGQQIDGS